MSLSQQELVEAAASGIQILDEAVPAVAPLGIPGVQGRISPVSHPFPNGVSVARLDTDSADAAIRKVLDRFSSERKAFGWFVGPGSTPADLPGRLEAAGLQKVEEWAGVALTDLSHPRPAKPGVRVEEVGAAELRKRTDLMASAFGFGFDREVAEVMAGILEALQERYGARVYLAFSEDHEGPVAFSAMHWTHHPRVMNLAVAATLEEYRGRGVYRSFVARRIADAHALGAEALVTQANRHTSAPLLKKLGFAEVCSFDLYAWMPPDS